VVGIPGDFLSVVLPVGTPVGSCVPPEHGTVVGSFILRNIDLVLKTFSTIPVEVGACL
jgi:hypothetical protein